MTKGKRRGRVGAAVITVGALAVFQALAIVGAGVAGASGTCTFSLQTGEVSVTIDGGTTSELEVDDGTGGFPNGAIRFDGAACGSATIANTTVIEVLGQPSADEQLIIDNGAGAFDVPFPSTISWFIDLGTGTGDTLVILGSSADDVVTLTNTSFDMNGGVGTMSGVEQPILAGFGGDDTLDASAASVRVGLAGGADDDVLSPGTFDGDNVTGGGGVDTLSYATRTTAVAVVNGVDAGLDANGDGDNDDAGDEEDTIECFEVIQTGSGNDTIDNTFCGTTTFVPGDGDDDIVNENSSDTIDWSSSSAGMTIDVDGQTATGQGTDTWEFLENFIGSAFDDTMLVIEGAPGPGVDSFSGGAGVDTVDGSGGIEPQFISLDILDPSGGSEADDLENATGGPFGDFVDGNDLANTLMGGGGDDDIEGDNGNDTLLGQGGNDLFFGGNGADTVSFRDNAAAGVDVDLSLGFASSSDSGSDSFDDLVEIIVGSDFNDTITGGPFGGGGTVNFLFKGRAGNDVLTGFAGNDTLRGGGGRDTVRGSAGDDTLVGNKGNDTLAGGAGFDIGKGGKGKDVCRGVEQRTSCGSQSNPASVSGLAGRLS